MNRNPKYNSEGYPDPTAYFGTKDVMKKEAELEQKVHTLVHVIRDVASLSGFEIVGRVTLRHKKSGKEFK